MDKADHIRSDSRATMAEVELLKKIDEQLARPPTSHAAEPKRIVEVDGEAETVKDNKKEEKPALRLSLPSSPAAGLKAPKEVKEEGRMSLMSSIVNSLDVKKRLSMAAKSDDDGNGKDDRRKSKRNTKRITMKEPLSPTGLEVVEPPQLAPLRNPLRIFPNDPPPPLIRPMTASTKRMSFSSLDSQKRIKYGTGKYARVELVPQPSDDPADPLNWPTWRKDLNLASLLLMVALVNSAKTALLAVHAQVALTFDVSYTAAAALTGAPLMLSALSGASSLVAARIWGKRPVYLAATLLIFIGVVINTQPSAGFGAFATGRVFQGLGWSAFDTLVLGSIHDTYFEHEQRMPMLIYEIANVATTWGPPLVGGTASLGASGFATQFQIIAGFMALAIPAIALGAPETTYDRSGHVMTTPITAISTKQLPGPPSVQTYIEQARSYLALMKPLVFTAQPTKPRLLQVPLALAAPTTLLLSTLTLLPFCALWGLASSLSLLFTPMPFNLTPASTGSLLTAPFLLATAAVAAAVYLPHFTPKRFTPTLNVASIAAGSLLTFTALLAYGLYLDPFMARLLAADVPFVESTDGPGVAFPAVSFVLGLLAMGAHILDATASPMIGLSTQYTSENLAVALRNTSDMRAAAGVWRTVCLGAFVVGVPSAVWMWDGVKGVSVGVAAAQMAVGTGVAGVWWFWGGVVRRLDGRVLGAVDGGMLRRTGSFFDVD